MGPLPKLAWRKRQHEKQMNISDTHADPDSVATGEPVEVVSGPETPSLKTPGSETASPLTPSPQTASTAALKEQGVRSREQQRRLGEARAREHVGAAGWQQTTLLEEIILAGREQVVSTNALRQVVTLSTESLRTLPLGSQESRDDQQRTLEGIVESGNQQVTAAQELEEVIQQALAEVINTPLSELNARHMERILMRVRQQIQALNLMIEAARTQVGTLEQLQALDAVSASYQRRLGELISLSAEEELDVLGTMGEQVVGRITELDAHGGKQLEKLGSIGEAAVKRISETAASRDEQLNTLEGIQAEAGREAEKLKASD